MMLLDEEDGVSRRSGLLDYWACSVPIVCDVNLPVGVNLLGLNSRLVS